MSAKPTREEKKARRRAAQNAKIEAKQGEEAKHYWQCAARGGELVKQRTLEELYGHQSTGINFAQYDAIPVTRGRVSEKEVGPLRAFADVGGVPPWLKKTLTSSDRMNYDAPTPIQKHTIPLALAGKDVIATAQTGDGRGRPSVSRISPVVEGGSS